MGDFIDYNGPTGLFLYTISTTDLMNQPRSEEITGMLREWSQGNTEILDMLMPIVYDELHRQASRYLRRERPGHTLQTTGLIHETYLKLIDQRSVNWQNRAHFFGLAAQAMRRILVDHARARHREKRGGHGAQLPLHEAAGFINSEKSVDLIQLDESLTRLAKLDARQARIVELRYFSGLSINETAEALHISPATVKSDWNLAKAWLYQEIKK